MVSCPSETVKALGPTEVEGDSTRWWWAEAKWEREGVRWTIREMSKGRGGVRHDCREAQL